jgi:hypothetical protein
MHVVGIDPTFAHTYAERVYLVLPWIVGMAES